MRDAAVWTTVVAPGSRDLEDDIMAFRLVDCISVGSGAANEDRIGAFRDLAWVVDGATDLLDEPLIASAPSDAYWFAGEVHAALAQVAAADRAISLADVPAIVAAMIAPRFAAIAGRAPRLRHEVPSAAGLVVRLEAGTLSYVALSDCSLLVMRDGAVRRHGANVDDAGDRHLVDSVARSRAAPRATDRNADMLVVMRRELQRGRDAFNTEDGYGVFSTLAPPRRHIVLGDTPAPTGTRLLLASDGFMRLADVFAVYTPASLFEAVLARGLASLVDELRAIERGEASADTHPRVKASDDASALLLEIVA